MKKFVAAFDGLKYAESTAAYALALAEIVKAHLVGVFMDDPTYSSYKIHELVPATGILNEELEKLEANDKTTRATAAALFEKTCQQSGQEYSIHHDQKIALQELKHESIYADLMIIDRKETLTHYEEKLPTRFIREFLGDAQCPVLLVPGQYEPIEKIILLYDGEPSSVHAIKMFSYLFAPLKDLETEVISVNPLSSNLHLHDHQLMKEFMKRHFPKASYTVIKGIAEDEIQKLLKNEQKNALVVLGAYRRGTVSRWFRESMADMLMKTLEMPLFIAHNR